MGKSLDIISLGRSGANYIYIYFFFSIICAFSSFCTSDYIVLCDQNSDLAGHTSFQKSKITGSPVFIYIYINCKLLCRMKILKSMKTKVFLFFAFFSFFLFSLSFFFFLLWFSLILKQKQRKGRLWFSLILIYIYIFFLFFRNRFHDVLTTF